MTKDRVKNKNHYISMVIWFICFIIVCLFTYSIKKINILPTKYFSIIIGLDLLLILLFVFFICRKKTKKGILIALDIFFILLIPCCYFGYSKINELLDFLDENLNAKYETNIYYFLVNKESDYKTLDDIKNKDVKVVLDTDDKNSLERSIDKKVKINIEYVDNAGDLLYELEDNKDLIVLVNSGNYDYMCELTQETDTHYEDEVRIIDEVEFKVSIVNEKTGLDITDDSFILYISGIDTRSGKMPSRSLSDVNILMAINPRKREILMVNTPRDYYVQIHGTTGLKDKLTHAGMRGGVKLSMATIEDLYDIDIDYYVRVNFNTVVKLVDAIGGITINSDVNYTITPWTNSSCVIKPGNNKVDGTCALAFARERHAYKSGDRHRGENQEQVISKIIEKVSSSKTILTKYDEILESLSGSFETSVTTDEITSLVKMQLDDMSGWKISTYNVTGGDLYAKTYTFPNRELYVMTPNMDNVKTAKEKIDKVLSNE